MYVRADSYESRYEKVRTLEKQKEDLEEKYRPILKQQKTGRGYISDAYMEYRAKMNNIERQITAIKGNDYLFMHYCNSRREGEKHEKE